MLCTTLSEKYVGNHYPKNAEEKLQPLFWFFKEFFGFGKWLERRRYYFCIKNVEAFEEKNSIVYVRSFLYVPTYKITHCWFLPRICDEWSISDTSLKSKNPQKRFF